MDSSPIDKYIKDYHELKTKLNLDISSVNLINDNFRKTLLLSCASFHEATITEMVEKFINAKTSCTGVQTFAKINGINRKYYTYFDWNEKKINRFLSMFGDKFKDQISTEIEANNKIKDGMEAFLELGNERNKMVHENYLIYKLNKTFEEIEELYKKSINLLIFLDEKFDELCK